ncbi:MAG: transposase [Elusimicrobia bacterium]|nr:transposase [Elusimicrobiota bacterium]
MGRRTRIHFPGAVYHAMAHGVEGQDIFLDDADRVKFLDDLRRLVQESEASLLAYCLMGNHFHLAIQVGTVTLSSIMRRLLTGHAKAFNGRHYRRGHLFWGRHEEILCVDEKYLAALIRYIHLNPVRARLVTKAEDWPWSSLEGKPMPEDSAGIFDEFDPWARVEETRPSLLRLSPIDMPDIDELGKRVAVRTGIQVPEMRSNASRRSVVAAKRLLTREAVSKGHTLIAIARWLNTSPSSLTRYARSKSENTGKSVTF